MKPTTEETKKSYKAFVEVRQKNDVDGIVRNVYFDFGDDFFSARQFVQMADEALTRYNIYFELIYKEMVGNED